ncbi:MULTISPECIES: hypothetical protein [unclassified Streptomyces]|uniref:hypothetical protein n=1 Tax=unclassified Streptomyces TaxID=2593676 RepID=UPI0037FCF2A5
MSVPRKTALGGAPWALRETDLGGSLLMAPCDGAVTDMDLVEHSVRQRLGAGDPRIVVERDPYASRVQARVRIRTLEATTGTRAEIGREGGPLRPGAWPGVGVSGGGVPFWTLIGQGRGACGTLFRLLG